ncbi:predicted protein [Histoplasma capsulatum G186AR]|uniref:WW domain-containing protein n=1 Tax=Ajellomyces capsulatus (strain G186AR / H82 / ATCC MYA-2454 / RMSCC 2432) TaxID=447093 RepID=C0P0B9_AJECG|nr:uncharacterized protein HCBG_08838 [Histoplasma capsulatum G186AR]EEH02935.1 predicted protein [Histoplasma capsulatum G186AR]
MSFAPPAGPPPPRVPDGWVAQFDDKYKEWFYVNLKTGISQWERPPVPDTLPPSYDQASPATTGDPAAASVTTAAGEEAATGDVKKTSTTTTSSSTRLELGSNNPYNPARQRSRSPSAPATRTTADSQMIDEDAKLAAKLQAEEDERAHQRHEQGQQKYAGSPQSQSQPPPQQQYQQQEQQQQQQEQQHQQQHPHSSPPPLQQWQQPQETKRSSGGGFFGKLLNKASAKVHHGSSNSGSGSGFAPPHNYNQPYQQQPYQQYQPPYPGPHGYNGYPPGAAPGGGAPFYGPQQPYAPGPLPKQRKGFGGIGPGGAAALGLGGGLLGGALLADAIGDHYDYQEGYEDGLAAGDFGGGDFGGGDFGGGDF